MGTPYHASPPPGKANEVRRNEHHAMSRIQRESADTSGQIERLLNTKREANGTRGTSEPEAKRWRRSDLVGEPEVVPLGITNGTMYRRGARCRSKG